MARVLEFARDHDRDVGRAGGGAERLVPRAALRPARPWRHRRAGRPLSRSIRCSPTRSVCSTPCRSRRRISPACRWAAPPRSASPSVIPSRFDRIIVCDSPCQSTPQSSQQWEERIAVAQKQGIEALVEPTVSRWFPPETVAKNPPHLDKVRAMIRATPVNGFIGCAAALADHDYASAVASVKRPVLFLVGEKDGARARHAQAAREAAGLALCRNARRRPYLQHGPAGGIQPRSRGFLGRRLAPLHGCH